MARPSEESSKYWLHERLLKSTYIEENDVLDPSDTENDDRPDHENKDVRLIDTTALREGMLSGSWVVEQPEDQIDAIWHCVSGLVDRKEVHFAKVLTKGGREEKNKDTHVIEVSCPNYFDTDDVFRVRDLLRSECGIDEELKFIPAFYTSGEIPRKYSLPHDYRV